MEFFNNGIIQAFTGSYVLVTFLIILSFLPLIVAVYRNHRRALIIGILNLFIGFTIIGWLILLVWAFNKNVYPNNSKVIRARIEEKRQKINKTKTVQDEE